MYMEEEMDDEIKIHKRVHKTLRIFVLGSADPQIALWNDRPIRDFGEEPLVWIIDGSQSSIRGNV